MLFCKPVTLLTMRVQSPENAIVGQGAEIDGVTDSSPSLLRLASNTQIRISE